MFAEARLEAATLRANSEKEHRLFEEGIEQLRQIFSASHNLNNLLERVKDGRLNNAFGTNVSFVDIQISAKVLSSNEALQKTYTVTLFNCTCPAYTKGNPQRLPCKHMVYLAYSLGILQIDRANCRKYFEYSIENATKVAPLPKNKKEAENARNKLSQL